jgi:predicted MPP superfamily phosphohydrolase
VLEGIGQRENTSVFVSRGVGTVWVPVRINCPPEVAIVTLRRRSEI